MSGPDDPPASRRFPRSAEQPRLTPKAEAEAAERFARAAAALRENLKRRKAQARHRAGQDPAGSGEEPGRGGTPPGAAGSGRT